MLDENATAPAGIELSDELRRKYAGDLSKRGLIDIDVAFLVGWAGILYFLGWLLTGHPWALVIGFLLVTFGMIKARLDERNSTIARQLNEALLLPDDALKAAHASHSQAASQRNIIIGVALVALVFGLVFTDRGRAILESVFH